MAEKIVFVGGKDIGLECIQTLLKSNENLSHIFCMSEDSHEVEKYSKEIGILAKKEQIPIKVTKSIKSEENIAILKKIKPDLMIVLGWRTIIPRNIFDIPTMGTVAIHSSLLPKYRGFAPVNWAVINGEKETGVTLFYLDDGIDSGNIVDQIKIPILTTDSAFDVYKKTKKASIQILMQNLAKLKSGGASRRKQVESEATYACARVPDDGEISWQLPTMNIYNQVRGLSYPYPGAFTYYKDKKIIIQKASLIEDPSRFAGRIAGRVVRLGDTWVDVLTGDGIIRLEEIDIEKQGKFPARAVLTSIKGSLGRKS